MCRLLNAVLAPPTGQWCQQAHALLLAYYTGSVFGTVCIYSEKEFPLSLSIERIISITLSSKYANAVCCLCGNFNSDATNDVVSSDKQESFSPEQFRHIWRNGHSLWRVVKEQHVQNVQVSICHISDFRAHPLVGNFCKLMNHSGSATVLWTPLVFTSSVSVTCVFMRGFGLHCALAKYISVCLSHKAAVHAWRSPGFSGQC